MMIRAVPDQVEAALRAGEVGSARRFLPQLTEWATHTASPVADPDEPLVTTLRDPDGYLIELVQWPEGHADGITADDFPSDAGRG